MRLISSLFADGTDIDTEEGARNAALGILEDVALVDVLILSIVLAEGAIDANRLLLLVLVALVLTIDGWRSPVRLNLNRFQLEILKLLLQVVQVLRLIRRG